MRLAILHDGHSPDVQAGLAEWEELAGSVSDVSLALAYRPEFFGDPLNAWTQEVLRGGSMWSVGERELMGAFAAYQHRCPFCAGAHSAVAALSMGGERVAAALEGGNAELSNRERPALDLIQKLVQGPAAIDAADGERLRAAGVDEAGIEDVVNTCAVFVVMARLANAFEFEGDPDEHRREAEALAITGYAEWRSGGDPEPDPDR
jgi:uncharacterized peroxidase-related enzyme